MLGGTVNFGYIPFSTASMNSYFSMGYVDNSSSNLSSGFYLYPFSSDLLSIDINTGMVIYPESYKALYMNSVGKIGMGANNFSCSDRNDYM
ncbi:hypothetical protein GCM10023210_41260 [Chryseobacterium ginsengisoli]|uniref:Uncharacterized protein n=1 Tax=Chryseobacterium ginsengisoli TaxID=363853 RepID=A0ABP9MZW0_9FLAO